MNEYARMGRVHLTDRQWVFIQPLWRSRRLGHGGVTGGILFCGKDASKARARGSNDDRDNLAKRFDPDDSVSDQLYFARTRSRSDSDDVVGTPS
jgi:hypothetical protein